MRDLRGKSHGHSAGGREIGGRLARLVGRLALWSCVLLLLIRGIVSVLGIAPQTVRLPAQTITVTQPATTVQGR
jgi:hypothetical protein